MLKTGRVLAPLLLLISASLLGAASPNIFLAESYFRQQRYEAALKALAAVPVLSPRLSLMKARCLHSLDKPGQALDVLKSVLSAYPASPLCSRIRHLIIQIIEEGRDWEAEIKELEHYVATLPAEKAGVWRRLLAYTLLRVGRAKEAVGLLEKSLEPSDLRTLLDILRESGRFDEYVKRQAGLAEKSPDVRRRLAALLFLHKDIEQARVHYRRLVKRFPDDTDLLEHLLGVEEALGNRNAAMKLLERLVRLSPADVAYRQKLGDVYFGLGRLDDAVSSWSHIVEANKKDSAAYISLAGVLSDHRLFTKALDVLRRGRRLPGGKDDFTREIVHVLARLRRYPEAAREMLGLAVSDSGEASELMTWLSGVGPEAFRACKTVLCEAIDSYPTVVEYYLLLDELIARSGGEGNGDKFIVDRLLENLGSSPYVLRDVARRLRERKRLGQAYLIFLHLDGVLGGRNRVYNLLAMAEVERDLGKYHSALGHLDRIISSPLTDQSTREQAMVMKGLILHYSLHDLVSARKHWLALTGKIRSASVRTRFQLQAAKAAVSLFLFDEASKELKVLSSTARSGLRQEIAYETARLYALKGDFDKAQDNLYRAVSGDPEGRCSRRAVEMLVFITVHRPAVGSEGDESKDVEAWMVRLMRLSSLLDDRALSRYDAELAGFDPVSIPPSLLDDFLFQQARSARIRGLKGRVAQVLEKLVDDFPDSPFRDKSLLSLADILAADKSQKKRAVGLLEDHLLNYPDSVRAEEARKLLKRLDQSRKGTSSL